MKKLFILGLAMFSLSSLATVLWPLGHFACLNHLSDFCRDEGSELLYTSDGCGCLNANEYFDTQTCEAGTVTCEEGTSWYTVGEWTGFESGPNTRGCGCFSIFEGYIPTSSSPN